MPLLRVSENYLPYLAYDAPVNEQTKKIREMFKVDESGYPEHYKWRPMARLGPEYSYTDPFEKLGEYNPDHYISTKVTMIAMVTGASAAFHWFFNIYVGKKFHAKLHRFVGSTAFALFSLNYMSGKTMERQAQKNHIVVDYVNKHPERFEKIKRYKFREILYEFIPSR